MAGDQTEQQHAHQVTQRSQDETYEGESCVICTEEFLAGCLLIQMPCMYECECMFFGLTVQTGMSSTMPVFIPEFPSLFVLNSDIFMHQRYQLKIRTWKQGDASSLPD
eukprot:759875-Hanusia_phi.AAC.1